MKPCKIVFKRFDENEVANFIRLSEVEYGQQENVTNADHVRCKYLQTPYGPSTAIILECADEVVGRAILQPRLLYLSGKQVPVAFVNDALIHPDFRRPVGNFISLMNSIRKASNFSLVFHTSNNTTENIYKNLFRFTWPFSLKPFGFPLNLRKVGFKAFKFDSPLFDLIAVPFRYLLLFVCGVTRIIFKFKTTEVEPEKSILDALCQEEAVKNDREMVRDSKFLEWRYSTSALWKAKILYLYCGSRLCGYVVLRNVELEGLRFTVIMDFSLNEDFNPIQLLCLRFSIIHTAQTQGDDMVFTLLNPETKASKKFIGFPWVKIPEGLMPQRTPIFIHINNPAMADLENQSNIHVTLGDLDYF